LGEGNRVQALTHVPAFTTMVHSSHHGSLHLISSLYQSCATKITGHAITSAVEERQEERTKTPYSLDINLIALKRHLSRCHVSCFTEHLMMKYQ